MPSRRSLTRASAVILVALATLGLLGCGSSAERPTTSAHQRAAPRIDWALPARPIRGVTQRIVGPGARGAVVLWSTGGPPPHALVIFLHGWQALPPSAEAGWIRHLAARRVTIVYPAYQSSSSSPTDLLADARAGIASAVRAFGLKDAPSVVIGRTTGGALAFDYAATATAAGLAAPSGVLAVFPGRRPPGGRVPTADLSRIEEGTELVVIAGPGDPLPGGEAEARALLAGATAVDPADRHLELPRIPSARAAIPTAQSRRAERQAIWGPADHLIEEASAGR
jgi:hypothetical protein